MAKVQPPNDDEERRDWIKRQKAKGVRVYKGRDGWVASAAPRPKNPKTAVQQSHRRNILAVSRRWRTLSLEQVGTWRTLAAKTSFVNDQGEQVRLNCFKLFVSLNTRRADLGLPHFDVAPAKPVFSECPVKEVVVGYPGGVFTLKARVEGPLAQCVLVQGARPVHSSFRSVQHFPFLGLLPVPVDGWSDFTQLYVARYGVPKPNQAVCIRICQHIDGFINLSKVLRVRIQPPSA